MRCSNTKCGAEGETKFCPKCGSKMVDENIDIVTCTSCKTRLTPNHNFCPNCGTKVDRSHLRCKKCNTELKPEHSFCTNCGEPGIKIKSQAAGIEKKDNGIDLQSESRESTDTLNNVQKEKSISIKSNTQDLPEEGDRSQDSDNSGDIGNSENKEQQHIQVYGTLQKRDTERKTSGYSMTMYLRKGINKNATEKSIIVRFHALISEEFKFDPSKHKLVFCLSNDLQEKERICKVKRKWRDYVYEMEYDLKIEAEHFKGGVLHYRYNISKPDKQECEWECFQDAYNNHNVRTVVLQNAWKTFDIVEQYDGVIAKSWGKVEGWVRSWKNELIKQAKIAAQYFSKDIVMESKCLNKLHVLLSCLRKSYFTDRKCWDENAAFKEQVGGIVLQTLADHSTEVSSNRSKTKEKRETLIVFALTALRLAKQDLVPLGVIESWKKMCKCLIMIPDEQKKKSSELDIVDKLFPNERDVLKDAFVSLARSIASESSSPSWLFLMPWIHFLCRMNSPYDEPSFDPRHDSEDPAWWGIPSLKNAVMKFKDRPGEWDLPVGETLNILQPLFKMDFYLPRTFMASLNLKQLTTEIGNNLIGTEVQLAVLICYIRTTRSGHSTWRLSQDEQYVIDCMHSVLISLQQKSEKRNHSTVAQDLMSFRFSTQLFEASTQTHRSEIVSLALHIMLHSLSDYERKDDETIRNDVLSVLNEYFRMLCNWMDAHYQNWTNGLEKTLAMWNDLYEDSDSVSQTVCNEWNNLISISVTHRLESQVRCDKRNMEKYVEVYCQRLDTFKAPAQTVLSVIAFQAIEMGYSVDYQTMNEKEIKRLGGLLSKLFLQEWDKNVKTTNTQHDILQEFLSWPPFIQFLKIYAKKDENSGLLVFSETCQERLIRVISLVQQCTEELVTGEILLVTLDLIASKNVNFSEVAELVQLDPNYGKDFISKAIQIRCLEIKAFREQADLFAVFLSLTQKFKNVNKQAINNILERHDSIKSNKVADICHPVVISQVKDLDNFRPTVCAIGVSEHVVAVLPDLKRCSNSIVFKHLWTQECKKVANECSSIDDVVIKVWIPVKERWDAKMLQIRSGHITFVEFEAIIGKLHGENYDDMFDDLQAMNVEVKQIKFYIQQLTEYRQLKVCKEAARVICKLADIYKLQGDFGMIRKIAEHEDKDTEMRLFDGRILEMCYDLTEFNKERIDCLNAFSSCEPLVRWLRKSMQGTGLKEFKVFVDLALISAGDEPLSIALVHYLNSAVRGYAQLIFELEETEGYTDLLLHCSVVWKELLADPALPQKLVDSNRYLDSFKDIKKVHGSVEVTSLMQAEAINEGGTYIIGKSVWKEARRDKKACEEELVLSDALLLILTKKDTHQTTKYSLAQLQDLQSRLMLVAGQGYKTTESVELYTSVFDSLTRLGNVYIRLLSSGCLLFKDLSITFRCNKMQAVCVQLEFGEGKESPILKGKRWQDEGLKEMIPNVAQFMERCLEEWLQHFKEKRKIFFHLNFYTVDQLVILQRELIKIIVDEPAHYVYPLLSAVKEHTSRDDLINAMKEAKKEITEKKQLMLHKEKADSFAALDDDQLNEKKQVFMAELKAAGYSNVLALKALESVGPDDPIKGMEWCLDNLSTTEDTQHKDEITTFSNETDITQRMDLTVWSESETDMQTLIKRQIQGIQDHG